MEVGNEWQGESVEIWKYNKLLQNNKYFICYTDLTIISSLLIKNVKNWFTIFPPFGNYSTVILELKMYTKQL
jgi:hypothetical protein